MNTIRDWHRQAMDAAELAFRARRSGHPDKALELFRQALELETRAADALINDLENEPTRSVLYRSAATLALDCRDTSLAERLAARGLAGNPPEEIAQELRDVLEQSQFNRHLQVKGVVLDQTEIQLSIAGSEVAPDMASIDVFLERIKYIEKLIRRTFDRITGKAFQEINRSNLNIFMSVPRSGSFAVSIRIGRPEQQILPGYEEIINDVPQKIIGEVLTCFDLLNKRQDEALKERFADSEPAYYQNFLALVQKIAPDGDKVNFVGITANQKGVNIGFPLIRQREVIAQLIDESLDLNKGQRIEISGFLRFADEIGQKNKIKLIDDNGETHSIVVPTGMMTDIVKPLWGERVKIIGKKHKNIINLESIEIHST